VDLRAADALSVWEALVAGRWSLVDHFDHGGRRYLVARRDDRQRRRLRLAPREWQVVAYAATGHANKVIAYELALSTSTVATCLGRAARKMGAKSRVELIAAYKRESSR
jgi:DNA-binding NarL/FixJ family response regulator